MLFFIGMFALALLTVKEVSAIRGTSYHDYMWAAFGTLKLSPLSAETMNYIEWFAHRHFDFESNNEIKEDCPVPQPSQDFVFMCLVTSKVGFPQETEMSFYDILGRYKDTIGKTNYTRIAVSQISASILKATVENIITKTLILHSHHVKQMDCDLEITAAGFVYSAFTRGETDEQYVIALFGFQGLNRASVSKDPLTNKT